MKIQIKSRKVCLECKALLGIVNKLFVFKSLLTAPSNGLPLHLKQTIPPIIWIFTEGKGDGIESRLSSKKFSTLPIHTYVKFFEISKFKKLSKHFRWLCFPSFQRKWRGYKFWHLLSYAFWIDSHPQFLNMKSYPSFKPRFFLPGFHSHAIHITWFGRTVLYWS